MTLSARFVGRKLFLDRKIKKGSNVARRGSSYRPLLFVFNNLLRFLASILVIKIHLARHFAFFTKKYRFAPLVPWYLGIR